MAPGPSLYIVYNLIYLLFIIITPLVTFHYFIYFIIQLTALFSVSPPHHIAPRNLTKLIARDKAL